MTVHKIKPIGFASNSYVLTQGGKECVVIDCAQPRVYKECLKLGLSPVAVLLTHGHYDHIGGCAKFQEEGIPIYCGEGEDCFIKDEIKRAEGAGILIPPFEVSGTLKDGQTVSMAGIDLKVISTPGHTACEVCYLCDDILFSGDTLFCESIGRTDLATGDEKSIVESILRLYDLEGDKKIYTGHGEDTTLDHERKHNPYVRLK